MGEAGVGMARVAVGPPLFCKGVAKVKLPVRFVPFGVKPATSPPLVLFTISVFVAFTVPPLW